MHKIRLIFIVILIIASVNGCSSKNKEPVKVNPPDVSQANPPPVIEEPSRAEIVMNALAAAYPNQIEEVEFLDDDWAVMLRGVWYFYAGGKILPQNLLENAENYSPSPFYNYQAELPEWRVPTSEEAERYRTMSANRNRNPLRRSPHFFDDLWRARDKDEAYERVKTIRFFGHSVTVHNSILENLSLVEETIIAASRNDSQVQAWINNISSLEGWVWRNIADTRSRSYHSYGLAIDVLPKSYGGKETYWLWASNRKIDWWNISYNERFHPPDAVIKAFEKYGFIWGGKWLYFDTMHFEYRPEILILSGMPPETRR
jgi:hypothetical protein